MIMPIALRLLVRAMYIRDSLHGAHTKFEKSYVKGSLVLSLAFPLQNLPEIFILTNACIMSPEPM